ncbi:MAG: hypothetical protein KF764_27885 [Labilithrix sp.]|nr:hypothetical protein [Labilithrix sp.]MBX3223888.1 hypothetical protein [Labilithrix sp.]
MNAKKRLPADPHDNPTRKVESMSSIAAELLLQEQDGRFDEGSGRRIRSSPPPARDSYSEPWRPSAPPAFVAEASSSGRVVRVAALAGGAVLLVLLTVVATLFVAR